jgi:hypothetical protein
MHAMTQPSPTAPDEVERELAENLRCAAWIFENEELGRFQGSILACQAVARFIHRRCGGAELAAPFLQIAEAFKYLEQGGTPRLFSKKTVAEKERERSPERKHLQKLAAMALEVLVKFGDEVDIAASRVAGKVDKWPGMAAQKVTGDTVIAWRKQLRMSQDEKFNDLVSTTLKETNPRGTVEVLLSNGPSGQFRG